MSLSETSATEGSDDPPAKRARTQPAPSLLPVAHYSSKGRKLTLEDVVCTAPSLEDSDGLLSFYAILDGHGGSDCARWAAERLPGLIAESLRGAATTSPAIKEALKAAFAACDEALLAQCKTAGWDDGACVIGVLIDRRCSPPRAYVTNLGDSKAFAAVRQRSAADASASAAPAQVASASAAPVVPSVRAVPLSKDHTALDPKERKRIEQAGGFVSDGRLQGVLEVSRSLGDRRLKRGGEPTARGEPLSRSLSVPQPDVASFEIVADVNTFLLLGCDGLWKAFSGTQAVEWLSARLPAMDARRAELVARRLDDPTACAGLTREAVATLRAERESANEEGCLKALVHEAVHARHAKDNVTALLVRLDQR